MGEPDYGREAFLLRTQCLLHSVHAPPLLGAGGTSESFLYSLLERLTETQCGVSPMVSDEIHIDAAQLDSFINNLVIRLEQTNNGQLAALCVGCLQICLSLQNTITGEWLELPPRLAPLLKGSKALKTVDWKIIALQADEEELRLRQGAPRSNRDWAVYRRTTDDSPEQAARRRDTEQRNIGLSLLMEKRYAEAADFFSRLRNAV